MARRREQTQRVRPYRPRDGRGPAGAAAPCRPSWRSTRAQSRVAVVRYADGRLSSSRRASCSTARAALGWPAAASAWPSRTVSITRDSPGFALLGESRIAAPSHRTAVCGARSSTAVAASLSTSRRSSASARACAVNRQPASVVRYAACWTTGCRKAKHPLPVTGRSRSAATSSSMAAGTCSVAIPATSASRPVSTGSGPSTAAAEATRWAARDSSSSSAANAASTSAGSAPSSTCSLAGP